MRRISIALLFTAFTFALASLPALSNGTLTGVITSNEAGSPVISGALVRTYGEPGFTATSGTDGGFTLSAPANIYNVLVSATGHTPERATVTINEGSSLPMNFTLKPVNGSGNVVNLPAPLDCGEPPSSPTAPGDDFPIAFADTASLPVAGTPRIAGWNDQLKPDETFTLTGANFTTRTGSELATDTTVWVWARMSTGAGVIRQARLWNVTENTIVGTLPDDIPYGMYLIWVENSVGVGAPVCINRCTATWVGPLGNTVQAGNKKRVFGRNISHHRGTTAADSFVFIQPSSGGGFISCPVNTVNPYMVEFTVPVGTPNGGYKAYVHNGHGGAYGWSDPLDITVAQDWVRGGTTIPLTAGGTDNTAAIQNAINTLTVLPNGGTVNLSAGNFIVKDTIDMRNNVELKGAGMSSTTLLVQLTAARGLGIAITGNHSALTDLTLHTYAAPAIPTTDIGSPYPFSPSYAKYTNVKIFGDPNTTEWNNIYPGYMAESSGCDFSRQLYTNGDSWVHNCNLHGGFYGYTEAAVYMQSSRDVLENNNIATSVWPVNPANGSMNYMNPDGSLADWMTWDPGLRWMTWAKRMALASCSYCYIASNTTTNVAVQDNRGEMVLFHGYPAQWFGNVLSTSGLTLNLRTDGLVDDNDKPLTILNYGDSGLGGLVGGSPVPDARPSYWPLNGNWAVVIAGKGIGQSRQVVSHTANSVTVDKPWTILPDSTSKIIVTYMYVGNAVYNNELNAFPVGYVQSKTASCGVDIDGNGWCNSVEGNLSRRTNGGRSILSNSGGISYWNVMRNETAIDCFSSGIGVFCWETNPLGPTLLGNAFRDCAMSVYGSTTGGIANGQGEGTVFERTSVTAKLGYNLSGVSGPSIYPGGPPAWMDGLSIYRKGQVTAIDASGSPSSPEPVYIAVEDGKQLLVGNSYSGGAQNYFLGSGLANYSIPESLYRVARFTGYVGQPVQDVLIPIANAGITSMLWTATPSDPWIIPTIQANGTLAQESDMGRLAISADTTGMAEGRHWGSVTLSNGSSSVKIGVVIDLASGTPANAAPSASFTATPPGGAAPSSVTLDASASADSDGSIASYYWDFGDGSYGSGVTANHTYASPANYTAVLTVTDNLGATDSAWTNITVSPALTNVALSGSPGAPVSSGTPVTLTASATGGYLVQYKFLINSGSGWTTLRDYQTASTCTWTPSKAGVHDIKAYAKNTGSVNDYDFASSILSYPVGLVPASGLKLWLKADGGVVYDSSGVSSWVDQSGSGNSVAQNTSTYRPTFASNVINGRPVVRFANGNNALQSTNLVLSGSTAFTTFAAFQFNSIPASTYQYVWYNGMDDASKGYGVYMISVPWLCAAWGGFNSAAYNPSYAVIGNWYRVCSQFDGTNNQMWISGSHFGPAMKIGSNLSGTAFCVGNLATASTKGFRGDLGEILIYNRSLSDSERAGVDAYMSARWNLHPTVIVDRIADALTLSDNTPVALVTPKTAVVASGVFSDNSYYLVEPDRTRGIKVLGGTASLWDSITLTGTVTTDGNGERVITGASVTTRASGTGLGALGMGNKALTASGQLVRIWGKVVSIDTTNGYFVVDDGGGTQVRVLTTGLVTPISVLPSVGAYVSVTGPAGLMSGGLPAVKVRSASDIQAY